MIDDELSPQPIVLTAQEATDRRLAAEAKLGVTLPVSSYERDLHEAESAG